jgi:hypothetical protein
MWKGGNMSWVWVTEEKSEDTKREINEERIM